MLISISLDIITIVGDLVDGSVAELKNAVEPIFTLRAAQGVYFVTGMLWNSGARTLFRR